MTARERMTLASALAVALGSAALFPLYVDSGWLVHVLGAVLVVAAVGLLCRRGRVPAALQPLIAAGGLASYVCLVFVPASLAYGVLPTGRTWPALRALLAEGLTDIERLGPPVPSHPGLALIATLGVAAVALVVDAVAVLAGRAALAGLPLLVLFAVPAALKGGGLGWLPFALGAVGWLVLLLVDGADRVSRWGTALAAPARATRYDDATLGRAGRRIGAAALGVAVVVPALLPGLDARLLANGEGDGSGDGPRTTTTYNPITRLRADLRLPDPVTVLRYTTDDPRPDYLRLTTLDQFTDSGWSASRLSGSPKRDGVKDELPAPIGLSGAAETREVSTTVSIEGLDARWLPVPFPPRKVEVPGPWLYDARSETVFAIRTSTARLDDGYTVTARRVLPDRALLGVDTGRLPAPIQPYLEPPTVTRFVADLTERVVAGKTTPYDKVAALQAFFRTPSEKFRYDESSAAPGINGPSALEDFLRGRRGFCEQYASAMGAMIRLAGVPARVAVGFTPGTPQPDGSFAVTTDNAHAWPEAWFAGAGWVRFEPTPRRDGQTAIPGYALPADADPALGEQSGPAAPEPSAAPSPTASGPAGDGRLEADGGAGAVGSTGSSEQSGPPLLPLAAGVAALAVLGTPRLIHDLRRRRRWQRGGALVAWEQVREDAADVGQSWQPADSPRAAARRLSADRALTEPARAALDRLATAAERARYARPDGRDGSGDTLRADVAVVRAQLLRGASRVRRWRARLLPPSTVRWAASASGTAVADALDRVDDAWGAVAGRLRRAVSRSGRPEPVR